MAHPELEDPVEVNTVRSALGDLRSRRGREGILVEQVTTTYGTCVIIVIARSNRRNALRKRDWQDLGKVLKCLRSDSSTHAAVITGIGNVAFSAGADVSEFETQRLGDPSHEYNVAVSGALDEIMGARFPVVAMVNGQAIGGGCEIVAACDLCIAVPRAVFGIPIGRLGVILGPSEQRAVTRKIGPARTFVLLSTGRLLDAKTAEDWGLVHEIVGDDQLEVVTTRRVMTLLAGSWSTISRSKQLLNIDSADDLAEAYQRHAPEVYSGPELREGVAAFLAKREPRFWSVREEERTCQR